MCGRFVQTSAPEALRRLFATTNPLPNHAPSWNVAPTQDSLVVRFNPETRARQLDLLRWGLVPIWAKDARIASQLINARAETLASKPAFRDAYAKRRCLVPIDAFYEWRVQPGGKGKQPYAVAMADGSPMVLAGLWERWRAPDAAILRSFTVVTTDANDLLRPLHDRMPVVLGAEAWAAWLGETEAAVGDGAGGGPALAELLRPAPDGWFKVWPVSTRVNAVRNNDAALLDPDPLAPPWPPAGRGG